MIAVRNFTSSFGVHRRHGKPGCGRKGKSVEGTRFLGTAQGWGSAQWESEEMRAEHLATTVFRLRLGMVTMVGGLCRRSGEDLGAGVRAENAQVAELTAVQPGPCQPPWHSCSQPVLALNDLSLPSSPLSKQAGHLLLGLVAGTDDQNVLLIGGRSSRW